MRFYRHYKNKPYRYIGVVRHSETLDEHVLYECLYENDQGKLWVRPRGMFHENVDLGSGPVPRFKPIPLDIHEITDVASVDWQALGDLFKVCFGESNAAELKATVEQHRQFLVVLAFVEGKLVGAKIGYGEQPDTFSSWMGGVLPEFRGLGIASDMMEKQQAWCRAKGYTKVRTKTRNRFREMLMLNLKQGFEIIGTQSSSRGGLLILLEKNL